MAVTCVLGVTEVGQNLGEEGLARSVHRVKGHRKIIKQECV